MNAFVLAFVLLGQSSTGEIAVLVKKLETPDPSRGSDVVTNIDSDGVAARDQLIIIGAPAVPELIACTKSPHDWVKQYAVEALAEIGDPRAEQTLIHLLGVENADSIRGKAAEGLRFFKTDAARSALRRALTSPGPAQPGYLPYKAAESLRIIGDATDMARICDLLPSDDVAFLVIPSGGELLLGDELVHVLDKFGPSVAPQLEHLLKKGGKVADRAAIVLGLVGDKRALPFLVRLVEHDGPYMAWQALHKVAGEGTVPSLMQQWTAEKKEAALFALLAVGSDRAVDFVLRAMDNESIWPREYLYEGLARSGNSKAPAKVTAVAIDRKHGDWKHAVDVLPLIKAKEARDCVERLLEAKDPGYNVIMAAAKVDPDLLKPFLNDAEYGNDVLYAWSGQNVAGVRDLVLKALKNQNHSTKILYALGEIGTPDDLPLLKLRFSDPIQGQAARRAALEIRARERGHAG